MQAPTGYDSVRGEPGDDLNYDECIGAYLFVSSEIDAYHAMLLGSLQGMSLT